MGLGREVADAYISVHGDLSPFRKDLNKAGAEAEAWAIENADTFSEAWGDRMGTQLTRQWNSVLDGLYSGNHADINKMISKFDPSDLDSANEKIHELLDTMQTAGKLTAEQYENTIKQIDDSTKAMQRQGFIEAQLAQDREQWDKAHLIMMAHLADAREKAAKDAKAEAAEHQRLTDAMVAGEKAAAKIRSRIMEEATRENKAYNDRRKKTMEEAIEENKRWARTMDGMRKNTYIADMESDFKKLAATMNSADMEKFAKSFDNLHAARGRIYEVTAAMEVQGRISRAQSEQMQKDINDYIGSVEMQKRLEEEAATAKAKAMKDALDATNKARIAQDQYNASLSGMARSFHFGQLEGEFRKLAAAMDSNDFSAFAQGALNIGQMRENIVHTANEMRRLGRMTDTEYGLILDKMQELNQSFSDGGRNGGGFFRTLSSGASDFGNHLTRINNATRGFREHLQGFAGLNIFADMISTGLDLIHNLDRIALSSAKVTTLMGSMASIGGSSLAGLIVIAGDLGATLGGLGAVLPGFLIGAGIGAGVLVASFKDMKEVLKDLGPQFSKLQDNISKKFWGEAEKPIRNLTKNLFPTLDKQLQNTGKAMGGLVGALAKAIDNVPVEYIADMFERMNEGLDIAKGAMLPLVNAFTTLGIAASHYFKRFGTWIVDLSQKFDDFTRAAANDGRLHLWIEGMIDGFKNIGRSIDGLFGIFNAFESAARAAGSGGLKDFADKLQSIAATMQSPRFQTSMTMLFEGMNIAVSKIGDSIKSLGPALESVMPSVQRALVDIGTVAARVIDYFGQIINNPAVQQGITDFSNSMVRAINALEPAMKPFGDSLGTMLSLLGKIVESVSQIATTFFVELSPVLDDMSRKLETMVQPLADGASKFITDMKGPLESLNNNFVGPLVDAITTKLIPAITGPGGFSEEFAKFVTRIVDAAGPSFTTLVDRVLPALVTVVTELLDPLGKFIAFFTPTLNQLLKEAATAIENIGKAMKVLKGEIPITELEIFKPGSMERAAQKAEDDFRAAWENRKGMSWGEIFAKIIGGKPDEAGQAFGTMWTEKIFPGIRTVWEDVIVKGITMIFEGRMFGDEVKKNLDDFWRDDSNIAADIDRDVNAWFDEHLFKPIRELGESIGKLWDETIGAFFDSIFGAKDTASSGGGGGGAGGKGMSLTGKLDPAMLGLPDEENTRSWFEQFGTWLWEGFTGALARLGEALGLNTFVEDWNLFWDTLPIKVQETWDAILLWIQTKAAEIKLAVDTFIADTQTNWTLFWDGIGLKVQEIWNGVLLWIQTKVGEIKTNIDTFIADTKLNWDNFWNAVKTKVEEIWNAVKTWIDTKVNEVRSAIDNFINDTRTNWDNFWNGVRTKVEEVWNGVKTFIDTKVREIKSAIENFGRDVKTNWDNFWRSVGERVRTGWDDIVRGFQTGVDRAVEWVRSLPGKAVAALGDLGGRLKSQGVAMIEGFQRGLESKFEDVKRFVGTIANWIAEHKGPISYDKVLLIPAGKAIMDGLGVGLRSQLPALAKTLDVVTATMTDAIAATFAHSAMYVAGADAALGLAKGLKDNKSAVLNAFGQLLPPEASVSLAGAGNFTGGVGTPTPQKVIQIENLTIPVHTPTQNPEIVAAKVIDEFAATISNI